jgi:hypothetical protein
MLNEQETNTIENVYRAMQAGAEGEDQMISLFTDDGVLVESFSGASREHRGKSEIRDCYRAMMAAPRPPDFRLTLDRIDTEQGRIAADWTCTASVMPEPLKGRDEYVLQDGKIARLEILLLGGAA